jgi:hypothetical protein
MRKNCAAIILLFFISLCSSAVHAQIRDIQALPKKEMIESVSREGSSVMIELNDKAIIKEWENELRTYGKLTKLSGGDGYKIIGAYFPGVAGTCIIYSKCYASSSSYIVWWTIDTGSETKASPAPLDKKLVDFARQQYIRDINLQIQDAEEAVKSSVKIQQKQIDKGENLVEDIGKNGEEKIRLEEKLKLNAQELVQLKADVEQNKIDQIKAQEEVNKMQKALELVKAKLNGI